MLSIHASRAVAGLVTGAAVFICAPALAQTLGATAHLTNATLGTIDLPFADSTSAVPGSVAINERTTVTGERTGKLLGQAIVNGTTDGMFDVSVLGQDIHAHEAGFQFTSTVINTAAAAQIVTMDFLINAGELQTIVRESLPAVGDVLEAGYEIVIRFDGNAVFESRVMLRQETDAVGTRTIASLSQSGTDLGGVLVPPPPGARDEYVYSWGPHAGTLSLGVLAAGQAGVLEYDVRTFVASEYVASGTRASIGDPFNVSWIGGEGTFGFAPMSLLDIQPGNDKNFVNPGSRQLVQVAVLGSGGFDATQVEASTVGFGPAGAAPVRGATVWDVNGDGYPDVLFGFHVHSTGIACADTEATLSGATFAGEAFMASDMVTTIGCRRHAHGEDSEGWRRRDKHRALARRHVDGDGFQSAYFAAMASRR